jgi:hypothetical protein
MPVSRGANLHRDGSTRGRRSPWFQHRPAVEEEHPHLLAAIGQELERAVGGGQVEQ